MDPQNLKLDIIKHADAIADLAMAGALRGAVFLHLATDGKWTVSYVGEISNLEQIGLLETVKAHLTRQLVG